MFASTRHQRRPSARLAVIWLVGLGMGLAGLAPSDAVAQTLRGKAFSDTRLFPSSPVFADQRSAPVSPSLGLEPEFLWESEAGDRRFRLMPFVRIDAHDGRRTHVDLREASAVFLANGWTLAAGVGKVFWGKTEAHHLVDIINQTDGVEDIDDEDKLGQPMVSLTIERDRGAIDIFVLPYFRERTFPGDRGRLRGPSPVLEQAVYESGLKRWHPDVAVRWSSFMGNLDLGLSAFRGTSREPRLVPAMVDGRVVLQPHYDVIDQVSVDAQWTHGPTLWKLEAMTRGGHGTRFGAMVFGLEHTFFNLGDGGADLGVLGEVMLDGRGADAPFTPFDHDLFVGARLAWNDAADTSVLGGPIVDYESGEMVAFLELERRIGNRWVAGLEGRWLLNTDQATPLHALRRDDVLTLRLSRFF